MGKSNKIVVTIELIDEIKKLIKEGKTTLEIIKIVGIGKNSLKRIADENNIEFNGFGIGNQPETVEKYFKEKFENNYKNYIYIGGYTNCDNKFTMKCKVCGHTQEKSAGNVRRNKPIQCDKCLENEKKEINLKKQLLKEQKKIEKEKAKVEKLKKIEEDKKAKIKIVECAECGKKFKTTRVNSKCCSKECSKKRENRKNEKRIYKNGKPDLTITLTKLIKRDKNICHICGEKCNGKDFYYRDNIFIAGEDYPSVDHVKPIAKGGTHTWDNVKLAHRRCNSEKRDKLIYETTNEQLKFSI